MLTVPNEGDARVTEIPAEVIDKIDRALSKAITTSIALADDTPYPDDPRWSPWTRFHKPVADRCREAREALRRWAPEQEPTGEEGQR